MTLLFTGVTVLPSALRGTEWNALTKQHLILQQHLVTNVLILMYVVSICIVYNVITIQLVRW